MNASHDHLDWLGFFVFGVLLSAYGLYAITLPDLMPDHWDWLTSDENAVEYITGRFSHYRFERIGLWYLRVDRVSNGVPARTKVGLVCLLVPAGLLRPGHTLYMAEVLLGAVHGYLACNPHRVVQKVLSRK